MKYREFYKELSHLLSEMDQQEIISFFQKHCGKLSADKREDLLDELQSFRADQPLKPAEEVSCEEIRRCREHIQEGLDEWMNNDPDELVITCRYSTACELWDTHLYGDYPVYLDDPFFVSEKIDAMMDLMMEANMLADHETEMLVLQRLLEAPVRVNYQCECSRDVYELLVDEDYQMVDPRSLGPELIQITFDDESVLAGQRIQRILDLLPYLAKYRPALSAILEQSELSYDKREEMGVQWIAQLDERISQAAWGTGTPMEILEAKGYLYSSIQDLLEFLRSSEQRNQLLDQYASRFPQLLSWYFISNCQDLTSSRRIALLNEHLKRCPHHTKEQVRLLELLAQEYAFIGDQDQQMRVLQQAFELQPSLRQYEQIVQSNPQHRIVSECLAVPSLSNDLKRMMLFFEGDVDLILHQLTSQGASQDQRLEAVLLLGFLNEKDLYQEPMKKLLQTFAGPVKGLVDENALYIDFEFLFHRLNEIVRPSAAQIRNILQALAAWIRRYCEGVIRLEVEPEIEWCARMLWMLESACSLHQQMENEFNHQALAGDLMAQNAKFRNEFEYGISRDDLPF